MGKELLGRCISDHVPGCGASVILIIRSRSRGGLGRVVMLGWEGGLKGIYSVKGRAEQMSEQEAS